MNEPKIDTVGPEVAEMQKAAEVCQILACGILEMRKKAKGYLPKRPLEQQQDWETRRDEADFFPAFEITLDAYVGKPLGSPIVVKDAPANIEALLENVDLQGHDFDTFARPLLRAGLRDGITWVVADYPVVPPGLTLAQERARGARPYLVHVPLENVIDYRGEVLPNGAHRCTHFRYKECARVQANRWGSTEVERIRVLEPGLVEVWQKERNTATGKDEWVVVPELSGPVSMPEVMVACYVPDPEEWWEGKPPLESLAWLNVTHWQSSSYQRTVLNVARVPLLACDEDVRQDPEAPVQIGVKGLITGLKGLKYVEITGAAIEAGERDLKALEDKMRRVAGQNLDDKVKTATESATDSRDGGSKLRAWVWTFQDFLEECLRLMALWAQEDASPSVSMDMDWDEGDIDATLLAALTAARNAGQISRETYLWNLQRGELMPPDWTVEQEIASMEAEGPAPMPQVTPFKPQPKMGPDGKPMPPDGAGAGAA